MEYNKDKKEIVLNRELSELDKFVLDFLRILEKHFSYVIVSGYVSILLGRSRATEDVDLLIPNIDKLSFKNLWEDIHKNKFECLNTSNLEEAFDMWQEHAIRFSKDSPLPNIKFKKIKNELDNYSFNNRLKVILKNGEIYISPLEMQIAYKLFLGSGKDLEDAKHLYNLFKEKLNKEELLYFVEKLEVSDNFKIMKEIGDETKFRRIE